MSIVLQNDESGRASAGIGSSGAARSPSAAAPASMAGEVADGGLLNRLGSCVGVRDHGSGLSAQRQKCQDQFAAGPDPFCLTDNQSDLCEQIQIPLDGFQSFVCVGFRQFR